MQTLQVQAATARGLHYISTDLDGGVLATVPYVTNGHLLNGQSRPVSYSQLALVSYQGTIIAFARGHAESSISRRTAVSDKLLTSDLYFNVLAPDPSDP